MTGGSTRIASAISIIITIAGTFMVIDGGVTYAQVSSTLREEHITVSEDACLGGEEVAGPFTAYCQAMIISTHVLESTGGRTYAELDREDPLRAVAMNGSFLRASLFTSVVAFGLAALAFFTGIVFILVGAAILNIAGRLGGGAPA